MEVPKTSEFPGQSHGWGLGHNPQKLWKICTMLFNFYAVYSLRETSAVAYIVLHISCQIFVRPT